MDDLEPLIAHWNTDLKLLTDHYRRIYGFPEDWHVYAARIIEDVRRKYKIIEIEGGIIKQISHIDEETGEEVWERSYSQDETFLLEYANYQSIAAAAEIELYQEPVQTTLDL